jgi:RNA-directed DNA polymerase
MDDMVVWGAHERLKKIKREARIFLDADLRLAVKHDGELNRCSQGVPFVGWVVYPNTLRLGKGAKKRFSRRIRRVEKAYRSGLIGEGELHERGTALYAAVDQGSTAGLCAAVANRGMVLPGYA